MKQVNESKQRSQFQKKVQKVQYPKIMISKRFSDQQLKQPLPSGIKLIVCNFLSTPHLQTLLQQSLDIVQELYLTKCNHNNNKQNLKNSEEQIYLIYMINDNDFLQQHKKVIEGCAGLANKLILIDIDNERESYIQKIFFDSVNTFSRIKWIRNSEQHRLVLIKDSYQQNHETNNQIEYYPSIESYESSLNHKQTKMHKKDYIKNQYFTYGISLEELIKIYQNFMKASDISEPWKVRYTLQKVYELKQIDHTYSQLQIQIFNKKTRKNLQRKLQKSILPEDYKKKLIWKSSMLGKYQKRAQQQSKITSKQCKDKLIGQITQEQCMLWIQKYQDKWLQQSLDYLKKLFNNIASHKDAKSIDYFRKCYLKMLQNIDILRIQFKEGSKSIQNSLQLIRSQIQIFKNYHQDFIQNKKLSGLNFMYQQAKYTLKHRRKLKQKIILFVLFLILALLQNNLIAGITIATVGIIMLSINI